MGFFSRFGKSSRVRRSLALALQAQPHLEGLETRVVPYTASGNLWPNPQLLTLSFVPDGTNLGGQSSNLFSVFNAKFGSASTWENVILKAAQQWAAQTNINFAVVPDSGAPQGSGLYQQGDPTMGDIRIGGYNFNSGTLAQAFLPPPVNNYSLAGDMDFNTAQSFNIGSTYDLFTVAMHEFGHALGMMGSSTISAAMYESYSGVKSGVAADDIAGIRSVYSGGNPRSADQYGATNTSFSAAANITGLINASNLTEQLNPLDLASAGQREYFQVTAPAGTTSTVTVSVQSQGLSLLAPTLTVYAADQVTVLGTASGAGQYGTTLTLNLTNKVSAGQTMYIKVAGADSTVMGTGNFALSLSFGGAHLPPVVPPSVQVLNGTPLSGGSGQANAVALESQITVGLDASYLNGPMGQNVAIDGQGNYVVTWSSNGLLTGWAIDAEKLNAAGIPMGPAFQVNTAPTGNQAYSAVAMDQAGDFVVVWESYGQDGDGWGIFAQRYDANANPVGGEFQVNTLTKGDQVNPSVAMDANGNFVVAWAGYNADGSGQGIFAQQYDANGNAVGGEFQVNTTPGYQAYANVAMNASGQFLISWSSYGQDGSGWGVYAQLYGVAANPIGGEFQANTYTAGDQLYSSAAISPAGNFVIVWSSNGEDGSGWGVYGQRYDAQGNLLGGEFQANTTTTGDQEYGRVAMNASGDFIVTWSSDGGGKGAKVPGVVGQNGQTTWNNTTQGVSVSLGLLGTSPTWGVYAQQFSGDDGSPVGTEFRVNVLTAGSNEFSSIAMDASNHIVVAWNGAVSLLPPEVYDQEYVIGADGLSIPEASAEATQVDSPVNAIASRGGSVSSSHPDVRLLPFSPVPVTVVGLPTSGWDTTRWLAGSAASPSAAEETRTIVAVATESTASPVRAAAGTEGRRAAFVDALIELEASSGENHSRKHDQPDQGPAPSNQQLSAPANPMERVRGARSGEAVEVRTTDAWFADEGWMSVSTEAEVSPAGGAAATVLDHPALALVLTGFVGSFQGLQAENPAQRRKQPRLVDRP